MTKRELKKDLINKSIDMTIAKLDKENEYYELFKNAVILYVNTWTYDELLNFIYGDNYE